jgi:predicted O-methyltransferase YrrM
MYKYSQGWFITSEIRHLLSEFIKPQPYRVLEIGSFEGLSSVFFAEHLLTDPASSMICVDPFLNIEDNDHKAYFANNEEANFDYNISICPNANKIDVRKITSDEFFKTNTKTFNFIYIDGCHECDFINRDMENSFAALEPGGIMWMDDYCGGDGIQMKRTMDAFLDKYQCTVIHRGYQLAIQKSTF